MTDLTNLAAQGRAYSATRPWTPEELEALLLLERERHIARVTAAEFIRNGIMTLEDYDRAKEADFVPLTTNDAVQKAEALLKDNDFATVPAEPEPEPEAEAEAEAEVEAPTVEAKPKRAYTKHK